jgi:FkbM family methyltransferase
MPSIRGLTSRFASLAARLSCTVSGDAARRFASWYGRQAISHPNYLGPIAWERVVPTPWAMLMRAQFQESLGRKLILRETHEPELTQRIQENLRRGDLFVDVGANIGYYTLLASRLVGEEGLVLAFEPSPSNLARLADNLVLNRCQNVLLFSEALSDREGAAKLSLPWAINSGVCSLGNGPSTHGDECFRNGYTLAATRRLDDVLASVAPGRRVGVVKIDAEGHEPQVLRGMGELLRTCPDVRVACEVAPASYPVATLVGYLDRLGFQGEAFWGGRWHRITSDGWPEGLFNCWFWRR